jgi:hypothetical protein
MAIVWKHLTLAAYFYVSHQLSGLKYLTATKYDGN